MENNMINNDIAEQLSPGTLVTLKSGGETMVIEKISSASHPANSATKNALQQNNPSVTLVLGANYTCTWMYKGLIQKGNFPGIVLKRKEAKTPKSKGSDIGVAKPVKPRRKQGRPRKAKKTD